MFGNPLERVKIETPLQGRLDDLEIRRDVEIAGGEQRMMADPPLLFKRVAQVAIIDASTLQGREDGVTDGLEGFREQCQADGASGIAAAEASCGVETEQAPAA